MTGSSGRSGLAARRTGFPDRPFCLADRAAHGTGLPAPPSPNHRATWKGRPAVRRHRLRKFLRAGQVRP